MQIQWVSLGGVRERGEKYVQAIWYFVRTSEAPFFSINPAISLHLSAQKRNLSFSVFTKKKKKKKKRKRKREKLTCGGNSLCPTGGEKQPDQIMEKKGNIKENKLDNKVGGVICCVNNYSSLMPLPEVVLWKRDSSSEVLGKWWRLHSKGKELGR